ncbi:FIG00449671: hypothetical protein [hydrothermal vent metagenome]|uniref:DUF2336 domain-containing protein n=1 Tax=hydrothermal vent metagenome TaxID=652676 RepID=A0A3B0S4Y2_9ZZZZ
MSVAVMRSKLTDTDIRRLVKGADDDDRAIAAHKLCRTIDRAPLSRVERQSAEAIMQIMADDSAELVRRALAVTLQNSPHLPRDLAKKLAEDVESIAIPILASSPVLTDDDLIDVVRSGAATRQMAIAGRKAVSEDVVQVIVAEGREPAVSVVAANNGAEFDDQSYETTLRRFGENAKITDGLISRSILPIHVAEKLVSLVSDEALHRLSKRHELPPQLAVELAEGARERATIDLVDQAGKAADMQRFVQQLHLNGRLTPSLVVRGLCMGHVRFVEWSLAELAGVPHARTWLMVHDAGLLGLRAIFERAGLPQRLYPVFRAGVDMVHEMDYDDGHLDRERFSRRMIERVLTKFQGLPKEELDYLLDRLDGLSASTREMLSNAA